MANGKRLMSLYMAQKIIPFHKISSFFLDGLAGYLPQAWSSLLLHAGYLLVSWLFLYFLYRKKIFLKV